MAGPTLGRLIKADIAQRFVSANLPMLHKRTRDESGVSEFRPGIHQSAQKVDLSDEFERQFFGDVMLFSMIKLSESSLPLASVTSQIVTQVLQQVETEMLQTYQHKHQLIQQKLAELKEIFYSPEQWWQSDESLHPACAEFERFIANIEHNFGDLAHGYQQINSVEHRQSRRQQIVAAIMDYRQDKTRWEALMHQFDDD